MKNTKIYSLMLGLLAVMCVPSCDVLDEVPDNRTEIDDAEKVALLLTTAYPKATPALICELSGDNYVDDNLVVTATNNSAYEAFHDELYQWKDVTNYAIGQDDTPYQVWEAYYGGIANCNSAIAAMKEMCPGIEDAKPEDIPTLYPEVAASWGEAHALRAYMHFILLNVFAESYKDPSQADMGIPYVTEPEVKVNVDYSTSEFRHTVPQTYDLIEKDLIVGMHCIQDESYQVKVYHFSRNTAYAFAARFYLYKRDWQKAAAYADMVLGANPSGMLRPWATINPNTINSRLNDYNSSTANCNLLIQDTYSLQDRMLSACRYAMNTGGVVTDNNGDTWEIPNTQSLLLNGGGPNWSSYMPCFEGHLFIFGGQQYGIWLFRIYEYFEYTDKIAGIGYVHILYQPFTADETLLCRAEAKLYLGDVEGAISDLEYWTRARMVKDPLTLDKIKNKYNRSKKNEFVNTMHPEQVGFQPQDVFLGENGDAEKQAVLDCILHFRRIETMYEGTRWFDIKRYGMTIYHHWRQPGEDVAYTDSITYNDKRRVIEVPNLVITAGYPAIRGEGNGQQNGSFYGIPTRKPKTNTVIAQPTKFIPTK